MNIHTQTEGRTQADSFHIDASASMRYLLLLNGVAVCAPGARVGRPDTISDFDETESTAVGPRWLVRLLTSVAPDAIPGPVGPIAVVLVL